jgi:hypothetical protein
LNFGSENPVVSAIASSSIFDVFVRVGGCFAADQ